MRIDIAPPGDSDFSKRWRLIKSKFSRALPNPNTERRSKIRREAGERGIWQRHYWDHFIRDDSDYVRHIDYIHMNPLKHAWVKRLSDWPYSTFHRYVENGIYTENWCGDLNDEVGGIDILHTSDFAALIGSSRAVCVNFSVSPHFVCSKLI